MGSHSYLVNLNTNIGDLHTSGLLNSHASRYTTTNVGHMHGDRTSVISLGELQELQLSDSDWNKINIEFIHDRLQHDYHFTREEAAKEEARDNKRIAKNFVNLDANTDYTVAQKINFKKWDTANNTKWHNYIDAHTDAALQNLWTCNICSVSKSNLNILWYIHISNKINFLFMQIPVLSIFNTFFKNPTYF